jgi:hypothetical protein
MTRQEIIAALDQEIERLQSARHLIRNSRDVTATLGLAGVRRQPAKRRISPEGRRRIIEAQRRRWAKQKKEQAAG